MLICFLSTKNKVRIQFTEDLKYNLILVGPFVISTASTAKARRNPSLEGEQYSAITSVLFPNSTALVLMEK